MLQCSVLKEGGDVMMNYDGLDRVMDEAFARQNTRVDELKTDPCMDVAAVGDHVLVDALSQGMGREPLEAEVLRVAGSCYECRFLTRKKYGTDEPQVTWVYSWAVLAVMPQTQQQPGGE